MTCGVGSVTGMVRRKSIVARRVKSDEHVIARNKAIVMFLRPLGRWRSRNSEIGNELVSSSSALLTGLYFPRDPGLGLPQDGFGNENVGILLNEGATVDARV